MSPLQTILQQLHIREALIWPRCAPLSSLILPVWGSHSLNRVQRFHERVNEDLAKRVADVVELYQPMTQSMKDIQTAVIECMEATLSEIKKSNSFARPSPFLFRARKLTRCALAARGRGLDGRERAVQEL